MNNTVRQQEIIKATWVGVFVNLILSVGKLAVGILGSSGAMVADAVHSLSDFATDIIVLFFVNMSSKPHDHDHDYGHGKYETLATVLIGGALAAVALGIFVNAFHLILSFFRGAALPRPSGFALAAAMISIAGKEWLFRYTEECGKKVHSPALIANAWHHRSDAFSSIGTLAGIGGAFILGKSWTVLDPIAAILVSALIAKAALELILPSLNELLEVSLPAEVEKEILDVISSFSEVSDPHNMKTRAIGASFAIECHMRVPGHMTVSQSHDITEKIEEKIRGKFGGHTQVILHVEPVKTEG